MKKRILLPLLLFLLMITAPVRAAEPTLNKTVLKITIGKKAALKVNGISSSVKVKWKSADQKIATVTKKGTVTAVSAGKTKITATFNGQTLTCTVRVNKVPIVAMKKLSRYRYFRKYMSESEMTKAYKAALKVVKPLQGLRIEEQVIGIAVELRRMFDEGMEYSMKKKHYNDPYGYLVLKWASCAGCARTTGLCLNMLGFEYEHVNENKYSHQWARVKVGKKYWICDAYGLYVGEEPGVRKHPYLS